MACGDAARGAAVEGAASASAGRHPDRSASLVAALGAGAAADELDELDEEDELDDVPRTECALPRDPRDLANPRAAARCVAALPAAARGLAAARPAGMVAGLRRAPPIAPRPPATKLGRLGHAAQEMFDPPGAYGQTRQVENGMQTLS